MGLFTELDANTCDHTEVSRDTILKPPFGWPGGKSKSVTKILPHLPYRQNYIEPFGGSYAVGLCRRAFGLEVCNDRYSGITDFYRCLRDPALVTRLIDWLELTVHSREEFQRCTATWENAEDPVERAARWYYMIQASFSGLGRCYGRALNSNCIVADKIRNRLENFWPVHERLRTVQIENQDWLHCMKDYDAVDTVFYIDPPYIDASRGTYKHELSADDHRELLTTIFQCKGYVALSGYAGNPVIDNNPWDEIHTWDIFVSMQSVVNNERNKKEAHNDVVERGTSKECLWIKY
jgi:DNA adenine methylase